MFEKEVYVEEGEIKENFIDEVAPIKEETSVPQEIAVTQEVETDDIIDFDEEELPDFLKGEEVEIIK